MSILQIKSLLRSVNSDLLKVKAYTGQMVGAARQLIETEDMNELRDLARECETNASVVESHLAEFQKVGKKYVIKT